MERLHKKKNMILRLAQLSDCERIMELIFQAKRYFKEAGIDQWQEENYPSIDTIVQDIQQGNCYVVEQDQKIIASCVILFEDDPNYSIIEGGNWLSKGPYAVMHRIVTAMQCKGQGVAGLFFEYAIEKARKLNFKSIRIDTHRDNQSMQRYISKHGFEYCGIVYVSNHSPRNAYECLVDKKHSI